MRSFLEAGPSCRASPRPTDPGPTDNRVHSGRDYPLPSLAREPSLPGPFFCLICGLLSATVGTGRGLSRLGGPDRSEEPTSELQSLMRISYAVFCLKKKKKNTTKSFRHINEE